MHTSKTRMISQCSKSSMNLTSLILGSCNSNNVFYLLWTREKNMIVLQNKNKCTCVCKHWLIICYNDVKINSEIENCWNIMILWILSLKWIPPSPSNIRNKITSLTGQKFISRTMSGPSRIWVKKLRLRCIYQTFNKKVSWIMVYTYYSNWYDKHVNINGTHVPKDEIL
jgi:hypothetical protein